MLTGIADTGCATGDPASHGPATGDRGRHAVARRLVLFVPGFDPMPPRRYRELFRREGAEQARLSGFRLALAAGNSGAGWQVETEVDGGQTRTRFEVLAWADIVQRSMAQGIAATYLQLARTAHVYAASGALRALLGLRKGPAIAALYPAAVLLAELAVALALGAVAAMALWSLALPAAVPAALLAGPLVAWGVLAAFRRADGWIFAWYLVHDFAFAAGARGAHPAALDPWFAAASSRITAALREDWDEVLVVGHSSGAHLAVTALADALRQRRPGAGGPALGLLTLGQVVPMVSLLPDAQRLRADLASLSVAPDLAWVDVSAPGDGCSFALCDPVAVSGMAGPGKRWPLVISAAFSRTLTDARRRSLRRHFFRLHFQYLCAFDNIGDDAQAFDYFTVTAGPRTLGERYAGRRPSASRIERPALPRGVRP